MKYEINVKFSTLEAKTEFEADNVFEFQAEMSYLLTNIALDNFEDVKTITVRKVDFLNESNNV